MYAAVVVGVVCSAPRPASVLEASVSVCQWGIKQFKKNSLFVALCDRDRRVRHKVRQHHVKSGGG